ncbi:MAG: hypothetical protein WAU91_20740 [Desulfatitalea sp.]
MTYAFKGLLLSGLVYPGLGQIILKRCLRGVAFILAATLGLVTVVVQAARMALTILEKIDLNRGVVGPDQILQVTHQAMAEANTILYKLAIALIICSWIYSAVDAFLLGRCMDRERSIRPPTIK